MNLSDYQLLSVLAREKNMRKAAERLFVSQPALSQRLRAIEKEWGHELFIRSHKGLVPTPAGEEVVRLANEILEKEGAVREKLRMLEPGVFGTLKIACASIVGQHWLPKVLKRFVSKYSKAEISLVTGWSSEMLKAVFDDQAHIGIIRGEHDWNGVKLHLFTDHFYLVDREIRRVGDLMTTTRPFIQFKSDSNYYQEIDRWWHRIFHTSPKRVIVVDQIETCKQMALYGIGYAILPEIALNGIRDELKMIPLQDESGNPIGRDTWMIGYPSSFELPQVAAFREVVQEYIAGMKR